MRQLLEFCEDCDVTFNLMSILILVKFRYLCVIFQGGEELKIYNINFLCKSSLKSREEHLYHVHSASEIHVACFGTITCKDKSQCYLKEIGLK